MESVLIDAISKYVYPTSKELVDQALKGSSLAKRTRFLHTCGSRFEVRKDPHPQSTWSFNSLEEDFSGVKAACEILATQMGKRVQCNAYLTPRWAQGLPVHYDLHDVLVLQLEGSKQWRVWDSFRKSVSLETLKYDENHNILAWTENSPSRDFCLIERQAVYLKAGEPHLAITADQPSFHLSFGIYHE